jgi:phage protein U
MDGGIDQLVPNCLTGDEYVLVRGKGNQEQQYAILVANKNNTRVIIDGDANSELTLNAGEYLT